MAFVHRLLYVLTLFLSRKVQKQTYLTLGKNTRMPCVHLVFIKKSIFLNIFKTKYTTKTTSVSYSVLLEACPQPCCKRSMQIDTILYYCFHIKEVHFEMFLDKIMSEYSLKLIKLCHFLKKFSKEHAP